MKERIANLKAEIISIKEDFTLYVKDKSVDLTERWDVWVNAPSELKRQDSYIRDFKCLPEDWICYDGPHYTEKYQTVHLKSVVGQIEDMINSKEGWDKKSLERLDDFSFSLEALKEEILESNLESFNYDW